VTVPAFAAQSIREKIAFVTDLRRSGYTNQQIAGCCGYQNGQRVSQIFTVARLSGSSSGEMVLDYIDERYLSLDYVVKALLPVNAQKVSLDEALDLLLKRAGKMKARQAKIKRGLNPDIDGRSRRL
jgi:hypothetical protein